jgi:poly(A) polymerase
MTQDPELSERQFAVRVVERLRAAGYQALWAGGCVRDELLGLQPKDYDVATDATPEQVRRLFRPTVAIGAAFGVIAVLGPRTSAGRLTVEVATFRSDVSYSDGRHPDAVVYSSPREDAERRDFTINGMFFDPIENKLIDYVGGQADLPAHILRAIGDPSRRFAEDKLRMLRGVRLATRFGLSIDPTTAEAIRAMADQITVVSAERIADELRKLLVHRQRARGVNLLADLGLVRPILPELLPMKGLPQGLPSAPVGDLWDHVMTVLERLGENVSFPLAFAALLHDVGKPRTVARTAERYTFYHHEHVGRRIASEICLRLKLSNEERERIEWLVERHQYLADAPQMRPARLKTILIHPGIEELLRLHEADALASGHSLDHVNFCRRLLASWTEADLNPPPLLTGDDLKAHGLPPGPLYKRILEAVREAQLDGTITTKAEALALAECLAAGDQPLRSE